MQFELPKMTISNIVTLQLFMIQCNVTIVLIGAVDLLIRLSQKLHTCIVYNLEEVWLFLNCLKCM